MEITLDQFIRQWTDDNGSSKSFISHFELNIFDFTTKAGQYSKEKFISSFDSKSFIGEGAAWAPRKSKWGTVYHKHPLMTEETDDGVKKEILKKSIKSRQPTRKESFIVQKRAPGQNEIYRKGSYYRIYTTEKSWIEKGRRTESGKSNQSYAAIHNTDPKHRLYSVNQYSTSRPEQRQFIGFHPTINKYVESLIPAIFDRFPLH